MEKIKRLKAYLDKDYTEIIDFPVELVGRDGVVRRYSYVDSIRIYQRRIESAHVRYDDREVVKAEIYHCTKRLEQIKRSWKQQISSQEQQFVAGRPGLKDRELYERGRQFLVRYIDQLFSGMDVRSEFGYPNLVSLNDDEDVQTFYVNWSIFHPGSILYVYRFENSSHGQLRKQYDGYVNMLVQSDDAADTEKLVHADIEDCLGFLLTNRRREALLTLSEASKQVLIESVHARDRDRAEELSWLVEEIESRSRPEDGPYGQAVTALRRAEYAVAFEHFQEVITENPYYAETYWALGELADLLKRWDDVEPYLQMALRYFPDEARSHYYLGVLHWEQHQLEEAQQAFARATRAIRPLSRAHGMLACCAVVRGDLSMAARVVVQIRQSCPDDPILQPLLPIIKDGVRSYQLFVILALAWLVSVLAIPSVMALPSIAAAFLATGVLLVLYRLHRRHRFRAAVLAWASSR